MKNINDLNTVFTEAGQKVSDLQAKAQAMAMNDEVTAAEVAEIKDQIDNAKAKRDLAKSNLEAAKEEQVIATAETKAEPITDKQSEHKKFVNNFKAMVAGDPKFLNSIGSSTDGTGSNAGLTIPQDIQTQIHYLIRQYESLEDLIRVEKVGTDTGSRVYEQWADITPLQNLDTEDGTIPEIDSPKLTKISFNIKRYAGIQTITNSLLKDTDENIIAWLTQWIAHKVMVTRNQAIVAQLQAAPTKATITKFDDIKSLMGKLDPAIHMLSTFVTNQSGWVELSKVKTATGKYLLEQDPTNPDQYNILGHQLRIVSDRWLPDADGVHPFYFGYYQEGETLFDREDMSIMTTNVGGDAFTNDTTKLRVIDRFDVQATDTGAYLTAGFTSIADQVLNVGSNSSANTSANNNTSANTSTTSGSTTPSK